MSPTRRLALAGLAALAARPALAADPGMASGGYERDGRKLAFAHAAALSQDNTEGLLEGGPQLRVVLSDVEVPAAALNGVAFPPVTGLARQDAVHGVMLEFSPKDPKTMHVTVLAKPQELGASLTNISLANSQGVFKRLEVTATRVSGEYDGGADSGFKFSFSAPLATDPVTADLRGPDAQKSEPLRVLIARAEALGRGDLPAAVALSSQYSDLRNAPPQMLKEMAPAMSEMVKQLKAVKRVVVRQSSAVVLQGDGGGWTSLVRENDAWKVAD